MVAKKRDKGGDERDPADDDASRAARRAARDKMFGRDPNSQNAQGESGTRRKPPADDVEKQAPRREVPMTGSAREVRRLRRTGPDVAAQLAQLNCDELAADISKKRRLLYLAFGVVGIGLIVCIAAIICGWTPLYHATKISMLALPICIAFGMNDLCLYIAKTNPVLARRILTVLSFGNPHTIRTLAWLYIDTGDYAKAEKIIASSVRTIDAKKKLRDYILMHAFLANLRAHVARMEEAEALVREVLTAAEEHDKQFQTDGSAFLLANTLNYAAQLCDQKDKIQDALALSRRAVKLLCDHKKPPADVCLVALSNAGYYSNVLGEYQDALVYLTKAHELATKTNIARDGQWAFILSNLAIANLGLGRSTMCKRALNDAETRAMAPLGLSERPHLYQCWAIYHFANDRLEYALQSYERAIEFCSMQKPRDSVALLRIIKEYSVLLREVGKVGEASVNEQRVTQIRDTLFVAAEKKKKDKKKDGKKKKELSVPSGKARFPIFTLLTAGFMGYMVWSMGLRIAPFTYWILFLAFSVISVVKVLAKYGPKVKEETSQGAISAIVSFLPYVRSIAPEVRVLPQAVSGAIFGVAIAIGVFVSATAPAPNTVPRSGLLPFEYMRLGDEYERKQIFDKAKEAFDLAIAGGETRSQSKLVMDLPKVMPSAEALDDNAKALELKIKEPKEARKLWQACIRRYPDFEFPYVNLATMVSPPTVGGTLGLDLEAATKGDTAKTKPDELSKEERAKLVEAEMLLQKALAINPNCKLALLSMTDLQKKLGRPKAGIKYRNRLLTLMRGEIPDDLKAEPVGDYETGDVGEDANPEPDYSDVDVTDSSVLKDGDSSDEGKVTSVEKSGEPKADVQKPDEQKAADTKPAASKPADERAKSQGETNKAATVEPRTALAVGSQKPAVDAKAAQKPAILVTKKSESVSKLEAKKSDVPPKAAASTSAKPAKPDDDEWETTPLKSVPIKKPQAPVPQKNWLEKAEEDAKAKTNKEKSAAEKVKADKDKARKKRHEERHRDDWKKLSPDDTDW